MLLSVSPRLHCNTGHRWPRCNSKHHTGGYYPYRSFVFPMLNVMSVQATSCAYMQCLHHTGNATATHPRSLDSCRSDASGCCGKDYDIYIRCCTFEFPISFLHVQDSLWCLAWESLSLAAHRSLVTWRMH